MSAKRVVRTAGLVVAGRGEIWAVHDGLAQILIGVALVLLGAALRPLRNRARRPTVPYETIREAPNQVRFVMASERGYNAKGEALKRYGTTMFVLGGMFVIIAGAAQYVGWWTPN